MYLPQPWLTGYKGKSGLRVGFLSDKWVPHKRCVVCKDSMLESLFWLSYLFIIYSLAKLTSAVKFYCTYPIESMNARAVRNSVGRTSSILWEGYRLERPR